MKIGVLTSSRADFGIYTPLIKALITDSCFDVEIIAFGTHLSEKYGYTISEIEKIIPVKNKIITIPQGDTPVDISTSIGNTIKLFAEFWQNTNFDLVFSLGDRFEMFAAVTAGSPFNIQIAHIHAGETTLGAIDNSYRHAISLMSKLLFVTTEEYKRRAKEIVGDDISIFNVGALSIENQKKINYLNKDEFKLKFDINLNIPTILCTFHPETVSLDKNIDYITELLNAFNIIREQYQIVITMPNSDTMGLMIRENINEFAKGKTNIILKESLGMRGYLSLMKHCFCLIGNTSSGFVEAAFFPKWVINLGDRQKGRIRTENIISIDIEEDKILKAVENIKNKELPTNTNIYGDGNTSGKIITILKSLYGLK